MSENKGDLGGGGSVLVHARRLPDVGSTISHLCIEV